MKLNVLNLNSETSRLLAYRYHILLFALVANILVPGFFSDTYWDHIISSVLNILILCAGFLVIQKMRKTAIYVAVIGLLGISFNWFEGVAKLSGLFVFSTYIGIVTYELFSDLISKKNIELKEIIGALNGYMLIGYIGALLLLLIHLNQGQAFSGLAEGAKGARELLYFSYITMLTIGYGEIVPVSESARGVVIILGLVGQFYLVVVIATFVGKFLMNSNSKS